MSWPTDLFSLKELEGLNAKQLKELRDEAIRQIRTSRELHRQLKEKVRPVYERLKAESRGGRK